MSSNTGKENTAEPYDCSSSSAALKNIFSYSSCMDKPNTSDWNSEELNSILCNIKKESSIASAKNAHCLSDSMNSPIIGNGNSGQELNSVSFNIVKQNIPDSHSTSPCAGSTQNVAHCPSDSIDNPSVSGGNFESAQNFNEQNYTLHDTATKNVELCNISPFWTAPTENTQCHSNSTNNVETSRSEIKIVQTISLQGEALHNINTSKSSDILLPLSVPLESDHCSTSIIENSSDSKSHETVLIKNEVHSKDMEISFLNAEDKDEPKTCPSICLNIKKENTADSSDASSSCTAFTKNVYKENTPEPYISSACSVSLKNVFCHSSSADKPNTCDWNPKGQLNSLLLNIKKERIPDSYSTSSCIASSENAECLSDSMTCPIIGLNIKKENMPISSSPSSSWTAFTESVHSVPGSMGNSSICSINFESVQTVKEQSYKLHDTETENASELNSISPLWTTIAKDHPYHSPLWPTIAKDHPYHRNNTDNINEAKPNLYSTSSSGATSTKNVQCFSSDISSSTVHDDGFENGQLVNKDSTSNSHDISLPWPVGNPEHATNDKNIHCLSGDIDNPTLVNVKKSSQIINNRNISDDVANAKVRYAKVWEVRDRQNNILRGVHKNTLGRLLNQSSSTLPVVSVQRLPISLENSKTTRKKSLMQVENKKTGITCNTENPSQSPNIPCEILDKTNQDSVSNAETSASINKNVSAKKKSKKPEKNLVSHVKSETTKLLEPLFKYMKGNKCLLCGFESKSTDTFSFRRHLIIHLDSKKFKCHLCSKYFSTPDHLAHHKNDRHSTTAASEFPCNQCDQKFHNRYQLKRHKAWHHTGMKKYTCTICGNLMSNSSTLKEHYRIHTGERPHSCTICNKSFRTRNVLRKHIMRHNSEKLYQCKLCDKGYIEKGAFVKHVNKHNKTIDLKCNVCQKTFNTKSNLNQHMLVHSDKRPHKCETCGSKFKLPHHLRSHIETHH